VATHIILGGLISQLEEQRLNACCVILTSSPNVDHRISYA
jgi:hypothetical protein